MCITRDNFREIVTFQHRYPRYELKLVPRIDGAGALKSDSPAATSTPQKSAQETDGEEEEDIEQESNSEEILDVSGHATSQKKKINRNCIPTKEETH